MPTLLDLPQELIGHIASFLAVPEDRSLWCENGVGPLYYIPRGQLSALTEFGKTCRRALEAVQPHFFRHLCLQLSDGNRPLIDMLMTWEAQPKLATALKTLRVSLKQDAQRCAPPTDEETSALSAIAQRLGMRVSWPVPMWEMSGFLLALVVLQAPQLEVLDIEAGTRYDFWNGDGQNGDGQTFQAGEQYPFHLFPPAAETSARLRRLRHFRYVCGPRDDTRSVMLSEVCKVVSLAPNVEKVELRKVRDDKPEMDWSSVASLDLGGIIAEPSRIAQMIKSCKALREFRYYYAGIDGEPTQSQILNVLAQHSNTIRTLSLSRHRALEDEHLGSLASFKQLEKLVLDVPYTRRDVLQSVPWLQSLHIEDPRCQMHLKELTETIDWFVDEVRTGSFPQFQEFTLDRFVCLSRLSSPEGGYCSQCRYTLRGDITLDSLERSKRPEPGAKDVIEGDESEACRTVAFVRRVLTTLIKAGVACKLADGYIVMREAAEEWGAVRTWSSSESDYSSEYYPEDVPFWTRGDAEDGGGGTDNGQSAAEEEDSGEDQEEGDEGDHEEMDDEDDEEYEYF